MTTQDRTLQECAASGSIRILDIHSSRSGIGRARIQSEQRNLTRIQVDDSSVSEYEYTDVEVLRVVDGDTVDLRLTRDIGFYSHTSIAVRFRLVEIDTPEWGEPNHDEATGFTLRWLASNRGNLTAQTFKHAAPATTPDGGFGRWLVDLSATDSGERLVDRLLEEGLAVPYKRGS